MSGTRRTSGPALVLCYHAISPDWPSTLAVSPEQFREQLAGLVRRGYEGSTFADIAEGKTSGKTVAVTFDDGYRSVLEYGAPILAELGLPATIFVPTRFVGDHAPMNWPGIEQWLEGEHARQLACLSWDELRGLRAAGWEVGSHTVSHARLPELDDRALTAELGESRATIEGELGAECLTLAYPYGEHDARVEGAANAAGYTAAATMRPGPRAPFRWPRIGVYPVDRPWRFRLKSSPAIHRLRSSAVGRWLERRR